MSAGPGPPGDGRNDDLSVTALVAEARARAGPAGAAAPAELPFTATLGRLVESCRRPGRLGPTGLSVLRRTAVRRLANLVRLESHLARHPEVAERPLGAPVVVTGLPRTGTTLVHNLLALDPGHRVLRLWEGLDPLPAGRGPGPAAGPDPVARAERWLAAFYGLVPAFRAIHPASATGPEECDALLQHTFASQHFSDMFDASEYSEWLATAPLRDEYRHYALQLRVLSGDSPPGAGWVLKSPGHLGHLDSVWASLPEATVVVCHRRPREAVASYASLVLALRRPYGAAVEPSAVGAHALTRAASAMARALPHLRGGAVVDLSYPRLEADPVAAVADLYQRLGRPLDPGVETAMRGWVAGNPRHAHGRHRYDLAGVGLEPATVDAAFEAYLDGYGGLSA